ncbi:hypothetical protein ScPMuIL_011465 [Solemya velum]
MGLLHLVPSETGHVKLELSHLLRHSLVYLQNHAHRRIQMTYQDISQEDILWAVHVPGAVSGQVKQQYIELLHKLGLMNDKLSILDESETNLIFGVDFIETHGQPEERRAFAKAMSKQDPVVVADLGGAGITISVHQVGDEWKKSAVLQERVQTAGGMYTDACITDLLPRVTNPDTSPDVRGDLLSVQREVEVKKRDLNKFDEDTGGFSDSHVLQDILYYKFQSIDIVPVIPDDPELSVMKGGIICTHRQAISSQSSQELLNGPSKMRRQYERRETKIKTAVRTGPQQSVPKPTNTKDGGSSQIN